MADAGDDFDFQQSHQGFLSINALQNMQAPQMGTSFSRAPVPFGNSDFNSYSALDARVHENPTPLRSNGIQDIRNLSNGLGGPNLTNPRLKRKVNYQDDIAPNSRNDQRFNSSSLASFGHGYSLYDARYEAIGLPVDPHLRIFNATNDNGKSN